MKTKYFYLAAIAGLTLASCSSDDFIAETPPVEVENTMSPIMFSSSKNNFTRAGDITGKSAADSLGGKFVVYGYKGGQTGWKTDYTGDDTYKNNVKVFDNYLVKYEENSAHKTESNTNNWEYVLANETNKIPIKHAIDNGITQQTIKYWDYSVDQYDFIAWSTGKKTAIYETEDFDDGNGGTINGIPVGKVLVSEITPETATTTLAYTFEGEADDLKDCYIADLITVYKKAKEGDAKDYNVVWKGYKQPVTLRFRQLGTKVRIGLYETVPGYSVKDVKFYSAAATALAGDETDLSAKIFTTEANKIYKEGKYTVTFPTVDDPTNANNNQAHIDFAPKTGAAQKTTVDWGGLNYTYRESGEKSVTPSYLGRSSNNASFAGDPANNYYVVYLPNETGTNLNLRVNYTLESIDGSKETITVKGATAQVPSIYTAWKPGYAYTYLFKISDKTNGHTGVYDPTHPDDTSINSDPAGLYPITFDAIVVNTEEDKTQETITLVSTPSITTYQNGSKVVNNNEYTVLTSTDPKITGEIYVTVNDGKIDYEEVFPTPTSLESIAGLYTKSGDDYIYHESGTGDGSTQYYRMKPIVENSELADLTGKAALYTLPDVLPSGRTAPWSEAEVIDALQMQDDDADANTVKGRSGLVLAEATNITTDANLAAGQWKLTNEVTYGVDGNKIDLTDGSKKKAAKFLPEAGKTYAFVYTQKASDTETAMFQAVTKTIDDPETTEVDEAESVSGLYRYKLIAATADQDVKKGVTYFANETGSTGAITAFLGQTVDNLFIKTGTSGTNADFTPAKGYAKTGMIYYYTTNGQNYYEAHRIEFSTLEKTLYTSPDGTGETTVVTPTDGTAYYYKNTETNKYEYCVFYPQRTDELYVIQDTNPEVAANFVPCETSDKAVKGMTYFDKYTKNNGVYYTKIIKVAPAN